IGPLKTQPTEVHLDQEPPPAETMLAAGTGAAAAAGAGEGAGTGLGLAVGVEPPPQPTTATATTTINNRRIIIPLRLLIPNCRTWRTLRVTGNSTQTEQIGYPETFLLLLCSPMDV